MSLDKDITGLIADALVDTIKDHSAFNDELKAHIEGRFYFRLWNGGLHLSTDNDFHFNGFTLF